jgi:hypothetical protein
MSMSEQSRDRSTLTCGACGAKTPPSSQFCAECGTPMSVGDAAVATAGARPDLAWLIAGAVACVLFGFAAGNYVGRRSAGGQSSGDASSVATTPLTGSSSGAPDISNMSPEERASRLFNRVMSYAEQGQTDSARFFAPMAIQSYEMLGPVDSHVRYDIGEISIAAGDLARAKAESDTILARQPNHLLGLVLAIRVAELVKDQPSAAKYRRRLVAVAKAERATGLKEYVEHARDIDEALKKAGASPD